MMCTTTLMVMALIPLAAFAQDQQPKPGAVKDAIDRGMAFLVQDALAWKEKHGCASCHHAALVVWSLREAKQRGHRVNEPFLAEMTKWVAESGDGTTGVPRPEGRPKALNAKAVWFALALEADPQPDETAQLGLKRYWKTIRNDQIENGSWVAWPDTRPPFFGKSDDSMTALATLTLLPAAATGDAEAVTARDRGVQWLVDTKSDDDPQSLAIRLLLWTKLGRPAAEWEPLAQRVTERQNGNGGWSQAPDMASDAWATGQALYVLAHAGIKVADPAIARGRDFLVKTQREDGSWPMTSRPTKPGGDGATSLIPITGAGAAWAVLGLVCCSGPVERP